MIQISGVSTLEENAADELVEVDGDVREEFPYEHNDGDGSLVVLSTGHVFRVLFLASGWLIRYELKNDDSKSIAAVRQGFRGDSSVLIDADVEWVVCGHRIEFAPAHRPEAPRAGLPQRG